MSVAANVLELAAEYDINLPEPSAASRIGGPPGALIGAATGPAMSHTLRRIGTEVSRRLLSPREENRLGTVFLLTAAETKARLDGGEQVRQDSFFEAALVVDPQPKK